MDPRSEVVIRQIDQLQGRVLFVNAPNDQLLKELNQHIQGTVWTWNYADALALKNKQIDVHFGVEPPEQAFDQAVIFVPKSKELLHYLLQNLASKLAKSTLIFLVGEKKGGVERAAKQLAEYGKCIKLDSARHCQFWQLKLEKIETPRPLSSWVKQYDIAVGQTTIQIQALPGVFSQSKLDVGTAVLLPYLEQVKSGKIADFGCGAGIIGCYLAKLNINHTIYALDVDAFALHSTQLTFEHNGINQTQFNILPVSNFNDAPMELDAIVSNPPFHQGIHTNYDASEGLCTQAKRHLKRGGELWIVANRFLNYPNLIEQSFGHCTLKADQNGFKVLYANV